MYIYRWAILRENCYIRFPCKYSNLRLRVVLTVVPWDGCADDIDLSSCGLTTPLDSTEFIATVKLPLEMPHLWMQINSLILHYQKLQKRPIFVKREWRISTFFWHERCRVQLEFRIRRIAIIAFLCTRIKRIIANTDASNRFPLRKSLLKALNFCWCCVKKYRKGKFPPENGDKSSHLPSKSHGNGKRVRKLQLCIVNY